MTSPPRLIKLIPLSSSPHSIKSTSINDRIEPIASTSDLSSNSELNDSIINDDDEELEEGSEEKEDEEEELVPVEEEASNLLIHQEEPIEDEIDIDPDRIPLPLPSPTTSIIQSPNSEEDEASEEEESSDEESEEAEEEPTLKYSRLGGDTNEILSKDTVSTLKVSDKYIVSSSPLLSPLPYFLVLKRKKQIVLLFVYLFTFFLVLVLITSIGIRNSQRSNPHPQPQWYHNKKIPTSFSNHK